MGRESDDASAALALPVSLLCSACGARCASAPPLTLPELFRHERCLLGTLAIRRIVAPVLEPSGAGDGEPEHPELGALALELFERVRGPFGPEFVLLAVGTFGPESRTACPSVTDAERPRRHVKALLERRRELALDRRIWGHAVFELLRNELFDRPERVGALPKREALAISLAPALAVIAGVSPLCRARCIDFLSAQIDLAAEVLAPHASAAPETQRELVTLLRASAALRGSLKQAAPPPALHPRARELEDWLGI
ncbi:MAG TPA: hypothetical protein VGQ57_13255 [Polyangiaceae bacterium]|jgi:hypothetical protein|nr:hypothetical protein [Polyangiaceae bacterium]